MRRRARRITSATPGQHGCPILLGFERQSTAAGLNVPERRDEARLRLVSGPSVRLHCSLQPGHQFSWCMSLRHLIWIPAGGAVSFLASDAQ